ncbi:MAG: cytochrome c oxidase subunit 4 [Thermoleophilaceae bacterium]
MAAEEPRRQDPPVPEVSEQIHLPGPSYIPLLVALGITIALVGVVVAWWVFALGLVVLLLPLFRWIADTRQDIADLPLQHGDGH